MYVDLPPPTAGRLLSNTALRTFKIDKREAEVAVPATFDTLPCDRLTIAAWPNTRIDVLMTTSVVPHRLSWKRTLRARKSSDTRRNVSKKVGSEQQGGLFGEAEHRKWWHIGESHGHIAQGHRTQSKLVDARQLQIRWSRP